MPDPLLVQNDQIIELVGVTNEQTGAFITTATVTCTIRNKSDNSVVPGQTFPLIMPYIGPGSPTLASEVVYQAILEDDLALVDKKKYIVEIHCDAGADNIAHWHYILQAVWRTP